MLKQALKIGAKTPKLTKSVLEFIVKEFAKKSSEIPGVQADTINLASSLKNMLISMLSSKAVADPFKHSLESFIEKTMKSEQRTKVAQRLGRRAAVFSTITPSRYCGIGCKGCYAGYEKVAMSFDQFDLLVEHEKRDMGHYYQVISGGEPFSWPIRDVFLQIAEKHKDVLFMPYTSGLTFNEGLAKKLTQLGNIIPAFSIEGSKASTDARRKPGTYDKVLQNFELCKKYKVPFGISVTLTSQNSHEINKDFFALMKSKGAWFSWVFSYMPIDKEPDLSLLPSHRERARIYKEIRQVRAALKDFFIGSFWEDGIQVQGCMAGGKVYYHLSCMNKDGRTALVYDPCVFIPYSTSQDIEPRLRAGESLDQIIYSDPLSARIREWQESYAKDPKNLIAPCLARCNIKVLKRLVEETGAKVSRPYELPFLSDEIVEAMDVYGKGWKELVEKELWPLYLKDKGAHL